MATNQRRNAIVLVVCYVLFLEGLSWLTASSPPCLISEAHQQQAANNDHKKDCPTLSAGTVMLIARLDHFIETHDKSIVAGFTVVLAVSTIGLWLATVRLWRAGERQMELIAASSAQQSSDTQASIRVAQTAAKAAAQSADAAIEQVDVSRKSLVYSQRAFVNLRAFQAFHVYDTTRENEIVAWQFTPIWENSGQTPTKGLNIISGIHPGEFPPDFKFEIDKKVPSLIGPKGAITGESYMIGLPELYEIQAGRRVVYIWGRAEYNDVFPSTRRHFTNFCHKIVVPGDPTIKESGIAMHAHAIGNYTDEDEEA